MKAPPLISVIIPSFNRKKMLCEAVESVLSQTCTALELIIVDDGSTDGTEAALQPYLRQVRYIKQENHGVSSARNKGIKYSKGEYLSFLDSDDLWMRDKLKIQLGFLLHRPLFKICYTDEIWLRKSRRVNPGKRHRKYGGNIFAQVLPLCIISPSSVVLAREVIETVGLFDESLPACEDYDFWIRIASRYPIGYIPKPLIVKRGGHGDQLSSMYWGLDRFRVQALERALKKDVLSPEQKELVTKHLAQKCAILAKGFIKRGHCEEAQRYERLAKKYEGGPETDTAEPTSSA